MRLALIFPPTCDPTAPYISVPLLTGFLRSRGIDVLPLDANVEGWEALLSEPFLKSCMNRIENRLEDLRPKPHLSHQDEVLFAQLWRAREAGWEVSTSVESAVAFLRGSGGTSFYEQLPYENSVRVLETAHVVISAAFAPLALSFAQARTPFALQGPQEIENDARPERNPFHDYYVESLLPRLKNVDVVGLSVVFPGQIQQAFSLAFLLRQSCPGLHVTVGGPAMTQLLLRIPESEREKALGPFHSAVLFEGEDALLALLERLGTGQSVSGLVEGKRSGELASLPPPDFTGLPLEKYFSPELVLPYDPTRGCYWGKCAFCHYGLTERGTARYRERPAPEVAAHLQLLSQTYGCRVFHLSQDALAPATALRMTRAIREKNLAIRWGSDIRPERALTPEVCRELAEGGALSFSFGVESASKRVLKLINKGVEVADVAMAIQNAAGAGIAVEAMCFSDFPTENGPESLETLDFLLKNKDHISLFICGEFHLVVGSEVAAEPDRYGIQTMWNVTGDIFRTMMFYEEKVEAKTERDRIRFEERLAEVSSRWDLGQYPWAGSLSTAHTLLWYKERGRKAFCRKAQSGLMPESDVKTGVGPTIVREKWGFNIDEALERADENETAIWEELVWNRRDVTRRAYEQLAAQLKPRPRTRRRR